MADKLRLGPEVRELKIGQSFTNNKAGAFHAVRYDFKPASVDINKMATVDIGTSNQVTVNVPHLDGAGVPQTVFKGSHRPFTKECVLIFDRVTGEIVLEKLSSNIQVKKTRSETTRPILPQDRATNSSSSSNDRGPLGNVPRPATPPIGQRQSNKTRVTSGSRRPDRQIMQITTKHSPLRASPNYASPAHNAPIKSPKRDRTTTNNSEAASLPMIGIDDFPDEAPPPAPTPAPPPPNDWKQLHGLSTQSDSEGVPEMSDTSSSSSSSDSDSDNETKPPPKRTAAGANGHAHMNNGGSMNGGKLPSLPTTLLNDDLQLSESGSDFDDDD